jgi:hypothetical protein
VNRAAHLVVVWGALVAVLAACGALWLVVTGIAVSAVR